MPSILVSSRPQLRPAGHRSAIRRAGAAAFACAVGAAVIAGCTTFPQPLTGSSNGSSTAVTVASSAGASGVRVANQRLTKNGIAFLPRGFNMIGLLAPDGCTSVPAAAVAAKASFGDSELTAVRKMWHANVVRFQVSQRGLDPKDAMYRVSYLQRIRAGVTLAEGKGLSVILSMQDQSYSCGAAHPLPSDATARAWGTLAPSFKQDMNVLFELFNEPVNPSTSAGWAQWLNGGTGPASNLRAPAVGYQTLVKKIRAMGANNVLIADGANKAGQLQGIPMLADPLASKQIAYAVHPYYFHIANSSTLAQDKANWDARFGHLGGKVPLLATEWNATTSRCTVGTPGRISGFLGYLQGKSIGLLGHAFDVPNTMVKDLKTWQPTTMTGYGCGIVGPDAGQLVKSNFAALSLSTP